MKSIIKDNRAAVIIQQGTVMAKTCYILCTCLLTFVWSPSALCHEDRHQEVRSDWALQDSLLVNGTLSISAVQKPIDELGKNAKDLRRVFDQLERQGVSAHDPRWLELYHRACEQRRRARLHPVLDHIQRIVFTKHFDMGGSHYAYTEAQSDGQHERNFQPGSSLCILRMVNGYGEVDEILRDSAGVIRDPDVSFDGKRVLFSWKKSNRNDDYHLYELEVKTNRIRQLTRGLGMADYEGAYLPGGDIVFNSTRCVQTVDCWWTEVSNLYRCDQDGQRLRRLTFDQVHTNFPTVTHDGRVLYTRWEYSDRGQIYPQALFQMYPDGTGQSEFYGNSSWFPTTILHARLIPGTQQVVAILSGHHTHQRGKLALIDPRQGRQEASGVQLIAPLRTTAAERIDAYGQKGPQFQYPYPISATAFLVAMDPIGSPNQKYKRPYAIYLVFADGRRELLASDPRISCNQPIPLTPRPTQHSRPDLVSDADAKGMFFVKDVYAGDGLAGVARGTIKKLRVIAIEYRAAGIRSNRNAGPGGSALVCTPIAIGNGSWDVKTVLGETPVHDDGSACFYVPSRTPVFFQALDAKGHMIQTMRSWSTLQPGETRSCVGCHEPKNQSPPNDVAPVMAMVNGPKDLIPFYGPPRGFSFAREIQPILDRHCVRCHDDPTRQIDWQGTSRVTSSELSRSFSLRSNSVEDVEAGRLWSEAYLTLTRTGNDRRRRPFTGQPNRLVNWISAQSVPAMLNPYHAGAAKSGLIRLLDDGHAGVTLSREELDKIACWIDLGVPYCGDYTEANCWNDQEKERYRRFLDKRRREAQEHTM